MHVRWSAVILGLILAAYWARVVRLAIKARRRTGKAANFVPPEPLGRGLRTLWYPVVVAWIVHPFVSAFVTSPPSIIRTLFDAPLVAWLGVAIAAAALGATLVCWKRMGKSWRMGIDPAEKTKLIVTGPYAYVRHPIYALSSVLMLASLACVPSPLMVALVAVHLTFLQWEARREERHLAAVHGAEYASYCASTGRFLPRFSSRTGAGQKAMVL
jgi:protein-S-isoprenylcysteine O-methyltransferase Ste14